MIGYAADETERLHRLTKKKQSILLQQNIEEVECFDICKKYNLLSPLYGLTFTRDGCWFCPNASKKQREYLKKSYPELYKEIEWMISITDLSSTGSIRNGWLEDYLKYKETSEQVKMYEL